MSIPSEPGYEVIYIERTIDGDFRWPAVVTKVNEAFVETKHCRVKGKYPELDLKCKKDLAANHRAYDTTWIKHYFHPDGKLNNIEINEEEHVEAGILDKMKSRHLFMKWVESLCEIKDRPPVDLSDWKWPYLYNEQIEDVLEKSIAELKFQEPKPLKEFNLQEGQKKTRNKPTNYTPKKKKRKR